MLHSSKIFIDACLSGNRTFSARPIAKFGALTEFSRKFHHQQHNSFLLAENFPQQDSFNPASYHEFYANSWLENDGLSVLPLWNVEQQNGVAEKQQIMSTNLLQSQSELIELQTPRELNAMIHDHVRKIYEGPRWAYFLSELFCFGGEFQSNLGSNFKKELGTMSPLAFSNQWFRFALEPIVKKCMWATETEASDWEKSFTIWIAWQVSGI